MGGKCAAPVLLTTVVCLGDRADLAATALIEHLAALLEVRRDEPSDIGSVWRIVRIPAQARRFIIWQITLIMTKMT
mgnify:CR=1 FL=1